ncbi:MAG: transketolase [Spirochaetales bacterium]|nr:transketolase [Spirochaetales bacterium]MCF7938128.1 transketolase [Spirochaetales bacterium]
MDTKALAAVAATIRMLTVDAIEETGSGHPGMPMGCADLGAVLFGEIRKHYPAVPKWLDRDRFVLSAGHGSMLQYSLLHLSGYPLPLEELKRFRRAGSLTPGHPEYGHTPGVEMTTGPLGAGFATAVGMAIAEQRLAARFNTSEFTVFDHYTYVISGDGCLMEGISGEAASLSGHLGLGKLIVFYDSNAISIEGPTDITFSEDVPARFRAYGWQTLSGSAHDVKEIANLVDQAKADSDRPTLITLTSTIGKGSPGMQGKHKVHGSPLGSEEAEATRKALGLPEGKRFYVDPAAQDYFSGKQQAWKDSYEQWKETYQAWRQAEPEAAAELDAWLAGEPPAFSQINLPEFKEGESVATRNAGGAVLQAVTARMENLIGGSADLGPTTKTELPGLGEYSKKNQLGRTLRFGVREHAMASIANGLSLHGGFRVFAGTILIFSDYMKPAMRLSALMGLPVIYILTHDSVYLGGDGPTHQPIEHLSSLRLIPNMRVLRPADALETVEAWKMALEHREGPVAIALSRQGLEVFPRDDSAWKETVHRQGAYTVTEMGGTEKSEAGKTGIPDIVLAATGSEVNLALQAAKTALARLRETGGRALRIRVISILDRELLRKQDKNFRRQLFPPESRVITVEAGSSVCWEGLASSPDDAFGIDRFGLSGNGDEVAEALGFTEAKLAELILS